MGKKDYRNIAWQEFREIAFAKLGSYCNRCSRNDEEVILQVHHKIYIDDRKPWEYNLSDCEILCSGCHAREHGHIKPDYGWNLSHSYDIGSQIGTCQLCGSSLRFEYHIFHNDWHEELIVGTTCCDHLTGTKEATQHRKYQQSLDRYLKKWCDFDNESSIYQVNKRLTFKIIKIQQNSFNVQILKLGKTIHIGKKIFLTAEETKYQLYSYIKNKEYKERFDPEPN